MKHLIVHSDREYFEASDDSRNREPVVLFLNRQYRHQASTGDIVYFWYAKGDFAGIHGWSIIHEVNEEPRKDPRAKSDDFELVFDSIREWPKPLLNDEILSLAPELQGLQVFGSSARSLFVVEPLQAAAINRIMRGRGFPVPDDSPTNVTDSSLGSQLSRVSQKLRGILQQAAEADAAPSETAVASISANRLIYCFAQAGVKSPTTTAAGFFWHEVRTRWETLGHLLKESYASKKATSKSAPSSMGSATATSTIVELIDKAVDLANEVSRSPIASGRHLLAAILNSENSEVRETLTLFSESGIDPETIRTRLRVSLVNSGYPSEREAWREVLKPRTDGNSISTFANDDATSGEDRLGFRSDYLAMASLIASRKLDPPLAIGIFGNWGCGKSFFMHKLNERVAFLTQEARKEIIANARYSKAYWRRIKQIEFNAWHYVDTNLWASLVAHIFDELAKPLEKAKDDPTAKEREKQINQTKVKEQALSAAKIEVQSKQAAATQARSAVENLKKDFDDSSKDLMTAVAKNLWDTINVEFTAEDKKNLDAAMLGIDGLESAKNDVQHLYRQLSDFSSTAGRIRAIAASMLAQRKPALLALMVCLLILVAAAIYSALPYGFVHDGVAVAARAFAVISGLALWISQNAASVSKTIAPLDRLRSNISKKLDEAERSKAATIAKAEKQLEKLQAELAQAVAASNTAERELQDSKAQLQRVESGGFVNQFIESRFGSQDYRQHLGIVSLVRGDFDTLSEIVHSYNQSAAAGEPEGIGISRIVLYIDDLDRCPPARVVEVLQAIHLLLAFKLFVVVVGVDARWITHSLKEQYKEMLVVPKLEGAAEQPIEPPASPFDYLEKIFQIPYWISAVNGGSARSLIRSLVSPQKESISRPGLSSPLADLIAANAPSGDNPSKDAGNSSNAAGDVDLAKASQTRVATAAEVEPQAIEIDAVEVDAMEKLAVIIGRSPRTVKRFINVYRLIRASLPNDEFSFFKGSQDSPGQFRAPMLLLAFVVGLPKHAESLVTSVEAAVDQQRGNETLGDILERLIVPQGAASEESERLQSFLADRRASETWKTLVARELRQWSDRVFQFSFVPPLPPPVAEPNQSVARSNKTNKTVKRKLPKGTRATSRLRDSGSDRRQRG